MIPTGTRRLLETLALGGDSLKLRRTRGPVAKARLEGRVSDRLGKLRGLPQKIGQFIALGEALLEDGPYSALCESPAATSDWDVTRLVEQELGAPLPELFSRFDSRAVSASLGQVHRACLRDGRDVAVKVQYPEIAQAVASDLRALDTLAAPIGGFRSGFDVTAYQREIGAMLALELDYRHEAERLLEFSERFASWDDVEVPTVAEPLVTPRVLVMSWVEGRSFADVRGWALEERVAVGKTLIRLFLASVLDFGVVHCDPHAGNYRFTRREGAAPLVTLLDFGSVKALPRDFVRGFGALLKLALEEGERADSEAVLAGFAATGFDRELLEPLKSLLPRLSANLLAPLLSEEFSDEIPRGPTLRELLGEHRQQFRVAGSPELIFVVRAYAGLVAYLRALGAPVPARSIALEFSRRFDRVPERRTLPAAPDSLRARYLKLAVFENGRMKVDLTFRAAAVESLAELVPDDVQPKLEARGIDADAIARNALATGMRPGELFTLEDGAKLIRVWLE